MENNTLSSCGLVALRMGSEYLLRNYAAFSAEEVLSSAVKMGISTQGEMFSAENLARLGKIDVIS